VSFGKGVLMSLSSIVEDESALGLAVVALLNAIKRVVLWNDSE
jgi:hypothetical protein